MNHRYRITPEGIEFLGSPPPGWPLPTQRARFSEIVPDRRIHPVKARVFRVVRRLFGEKGRASDWTRRWDCMWVCIILRGPLAGRRSVSRRRQVLINWEEHIWQYGKAPNE